MGADGFSSRDSSIKKPPIIGTVIASYVFLFRHLGHAAKMGWPYLVFLLLGASLQLSFSFFVHNNFDATFQLMSSNWFGLSFFLLNLWLGFLYLLFITAYCVGWMRAITRGVSDQNFCALKREGTLIFCCIAQLLGIYISCIFILYFVAFLSACFLYLVGYLLPPAMSEPTLLFFASIPSIFTTIFFLSLIPFAVLAPSFLYFPAKANGFVISSNLGRKLFKGLSLRFFVSIAVALLPLGLAFFLYFYFLGELALLIHKMPNGFVLFNAALAALAVVMNFLFPPIFCGVLSGYYLWVKKHRIADKPVSSKAKSPFDDDAWDNVKMWEDFD